MVHCAPGVPLATYPIESGFGASGQFETVLDSTPNPAWDGHSVYLFSPLNGSFPAPTILFCHGIGADDPHVYLELIHHLVSHGYCVVYSPYSKLSALQSPIAAYQVMWSGFETAAKTWSTKLDTTRIGFVGHSFGAGAIPSLALKAITKRSWGRKGVFMFIMAPWYVCQVSQEQLAQFPQNVKCVVEIFDNDRVNDHRIAIDLFRTIGIPQSEKDFITLRSDTCGADTLIADHGVPEGTYRFGWDVNALDYYGVYQLVDALAEYTFLGNQTAKAVALGHGAQCQRYMGNWWNGRLIRELQSNSAPTTTFPQSRFINFWNHAANPRARMHLFLDSADTSRITSWSTIQNYASAMNFQQRASSRSESASSEPKLLSRHVENGNLRNRDSSKSANLTSGSGPCLEQIAPLAVGYGAQGSHQVIERSYSHSQGGSGNLCLFRPIDMKEPVPVVLFAPEINSQGKDYRQLLTNLASQGYAVISSVYRYGAFVNDTERYDALVEGYNEVVELNRDHLDTTKIGFLGHSYGAGAIPAVAWQYLVKKRWGSQGTFIFLMSPSYVHCFSQTQFEHFPKNAKLIVEVFDNDHTNDYRIAEDIFFAINIGLDDKDFLVAKNATRSEISYEAGFKLPMGTDAHDVGPLQPYAIRRPLDALASYVFNGDISAKRVVLGHGDSMQVYMGCWCDKTPVTPMIATDVPTVHNQRWPDPGAFVSFLGYLNKAWPISLFCGFDDPRNERRACRVP